MLRWDAKHVGFASVSFGRVFNLLGFLRQPNLIKRFSRRGRKKVDGQWKLMMLHNILKIHRYGWEWA